MKTIDFFIKQTKGLIQKGVNPTTALRLAFIDCREDSLCGVLDTLDTLVGNMQSIGWKDGTTWHNPQLLTEIIEEKLIHDMLNEEN